MDYTFSAGCRGYLVELVQAQLQAKLGKAIPGGVDGRWGTGTTDGLVEFAAGQPNRRELEREGAFQGRAGVKVFAALGIDWPGLFARCLQLTMGFEGTGFGGSCGPKQTGDTAGVTFGAIGFTSYNSELQGLLREARATNAQVFDEIAWKHVPHDRGFLLSLIGKDTPAREFEKWGLDGNGSVKPRLKAFLAELGGEDWFKQLQMIWAHDRYWQRAVRQAEALFGRTAKDEHGRTRTVVESARPFALLFDVAVQNGGLKPLEISDLQALFARQEHDETERMYAVGTMLTQRLRNAGRPSRIIDDVRSRKNAIAKGDGVVHGAHWILEKFAL